MPNESRQDALPLFWKALGASGGAMMASLLMSVAVARILGAEGRGLLAALQLWPSILGGVATLGLPAAAAFHIRKHPKLQATVFTTGLVLVFTSALGAAVIGWWQLPTLLPTLSTHQLPAARFYLLIGLPVTAVFIFVGGCGQAMSDMSIFNLAKVLPVLVQVPVFGGLLVAGLVTAEHIAFGFLAAQLAVALWLITATGRQFGFSLSRKRAVVSAMLIYGVGIWTSEILGTITLNADKLSISQWLSLRDLGVYSVAYALSRMASHLPNAVAAVIFPRNVGRGKAEVVASTARAFRLSFWPALIVAVPVAVACQPLFVRVFGAEFAASGLIFPLLIAECLIGSGSWVLAQAFNALARPGLIIVRQLSGLLTFCVLAFALMPHLGIVGAALAVLGASLVRLLATLATFRAGLGVSTPQILWQREDWHTLVAALRVKFRKK